jgi:hypothetical protein
VVAVSLGGRRASALGPGGNKPAPRRELGSSGWRRVIIFPAALANPRLPEVTAFSVLSPGSYDLRGRQREPVDVATARIHHLSNAVSRPPGPKDR